MPDVVQFSNGNQIKNRYASDGRKLGTEYFTQLTTIQPLAEGTVLNQVYQANVVDQTGTAYIGNFEYKTYWNVPLYTTLKKVFNTEGYVDEYNNNQPYSGYVYFRKDHLGNNREVWRAGKPGGNAATTIQRTWYYPGGLPWNYTTGTGASVQSYKYNLKEFIEMHGYDVSDLGWRGLHHAKFRFDSFDPDAELDYSISPYVACHNNPVLKIDPNGRWVETAWDVFSLATGATSFVNNIKQGNINGAILDGVGVVFDAAATILPLVPAGAGAAIKATRSVDEVADMKKVSTMTENAKNGKAFEKVIGEKLIGPKAEQITIETSDRIKTKLDFVQNKNGKISLIEVKSTESAPLTKNQKIGASTN